MTQSKRKNTQENISMCNSIYFIVCLFLSFREFDQQAARIIDKCFTQNEQLALQILTTKSKLYFGYSPLTLATEANSRSFLATNCVQKYLDRLWYGRLDQHGYGNIYINLMVRNK
jgi:hypothetical protein